MLQCSFYKLLRFVCGSGSQCVSILFLTCACVLFSAGFFVVACCIRKVIFTLDLSVFVIYLFICLFILFIHLSIHVFIYESACYSIKWLMTYRN
jgi:hypothetical protein